MKVLSKHPWEVVGKGDGGETSSLYTCKSLSKNRCIKKLFEVKNVFSNMETTITHPTPQFVHKWVLRYTLYHSYGAFFIFCYSIFSLWHPEIVSSLTFRNSVDNDTSNNRGGDWVGVSGRGKQTDKQTKQSFRNCWLLPRIKTTISLLTSSYTQAVLEWEQLGLVITLLSWLDLWEFKAKERNSGTILQST